MAILFGGLRRAVGTAIFLLSSAAYAAGPPSRAGAIAAADAALAAPAPEAGVALCATPPDSGQKLAGDMGLSAEGHAMEFANGGGGDALVKIRHADSGRLAASFFLRRMETITIEGVPDGSYITQYAFGPALAPDCKSLTRIIKANQLPDKDVFKTEVVDDDEHTEVKRMTVAYQLSVTETANVKPISIDAAAFNAE